MGYLGTQKITDTTFTTPSGGQGTVTAGGSTAIVGGSLLTGLGSDKRGVVYLINTDASATVYYRLDGGTASAGGDSTPLPAGKDVSIGLLDDVSQVTLFGTGQSVGWALLAPAS